MGYFHGNLEINPDSTYAYYEWNHTGQTLKDKGVLISKDGVLFLNSSKKTRRNSTHGKSEKFYLFEMKEIEILDDKVFILPCDEVFPEYCTFWKK